MTDRCVDVLVVGAGFGGMYALHRLRSDGFSVRVIESGSGVGGTWYWNRYPGARCDVESLEYSYSFDDNLQQEWKWTERYAPQPEILDYAEHVADRYDLRRDIEFDTRVTAARFDEATSRWTVTTQPVVGRAIRGDDLGTDVTAYDARFVVMATGCLSSTNVPDVAGIDEFTGELLHTGRWPHAGVDFAGQRVAVIGTGSSGVQAIPLIAAQAEQLTVYQRTATYTAPAQNAPLDPAVEADVKARYADFRAELQRRSTAFGASYPRPLGSALDHTLEERTAILEERWQLGGFALSSAFSDLLLDQDANTAVADFIRSKIRTIVTDPATAELLSGSDVRMQATMCRFGLLRDLQSIQRVAHQRARQPDRAIDRSRDRARRWVDVRVRRDRVRHRLRRDDRQLDADRHRRPRWCDAARSMGGWSRGRFSAWGCPASRICSP